MHVPGCPPATLPAGSLHRHRPDRHPHLQLQLTDRLRRCGAVLVEAVCRGSGPGGARTHIRLLFPRDAQGHGSSPTRHPATASTFAQVIQLQWGCCRSAAAPLPALSDSASSPKHHCSHPAHALILTFTSLPCPSLIAPLRPQLGDGPFMDFASRRRIVLILPRQVRC